jgi:hypothetical protein
VNLQYAAGDLDANNLAIQFGTIFRAAKWQVGLTGITFVGSAIFGIWVPDPPATDTPIIREAFRAVGIAFNPSALPKFSQIMEFGGGVSGGAVVFIGTKSPNRFGEMPAHAGHSE